MAAVEPITTGPEEDQDKMAPPEEDTAIKETSTPLDFTELTPSQFGISVKSFIPSSSVSKDKTRLAQIKARRRSSVGVRGSPETNSLIRFIAQQRMKTPPAPQTPKPVRGSPLFPRVTSTLRQKMASFQSLMDVAESDACDPTPVRDGSAGGCIMTRDYLSDGISRSEGKENNPPTSPTPSKKRRLGPLDGCGSEISEAEQEEAAGQQQSPSRPASDHPAAASPPRRAPPAHVSPVPFLLQIKPSEDDSTETCAAKKKKQVRFGGPLSPEFFDKNLPPSTPLQKGGTPARAPTPGGSFQPRSALKTPQRREADAPQCEPERYSPAVFGASPTFAVSRKHRRLSEDGELLFLPMEEFDSVMTADSELAPDAQPLNLNAAFHEESLPPVLAEFDTKSSQSSQMDLMEERKSVPEENGSEAADESPTPARSSSRRRKTEREPKSEPRARPGNRKRKPEESNPVKRSTRAAAKTACRKIKKASSAARRWDKDVDRSLYGSRAYASKNPGLSPIRERLSFGSQTPKSCAAQSKKSFVILEVAKNAQENDDSVVTKDTPSPTSGKENSRPSRSPLRRRGQRKVSVADSEESRDQAGGKTEQLLEEQSSSSLEFSVGTPSKPGLAPQADVNAEEPDARIPADTSCADTGRTEDHTSLCSSSPAAEEPSTAEPKLKRAKRGRRSSQKCPPEEDQSRCGKEGNGLRGQAASLISDLQEEAWGARADLAPWQADFNFEDVFKPAARRGQRSVRRSLRNQHGSEQSAGTAGLAWLPHTSPDSVKEARRKTRQRRLSASLPVQSPLPEGTQDASLDLTGDSQ
ncbi:cell division cycle-associated protein 2 isoform X3 [Kryptolebias marmoratus]|uniref:cell division cycle-associated protein 2 isoform X3 n=1 Tax=Kryptolebias marmoratus TaxID=37003 RepID=UPI0007F8D728|nr:cell division cycle-associated protein 2 isoform X3 [Kryptolebias marmoratus]